MRPRLLCGIRECDQDVRSTHVIGECSMAHLASVTDHASAPQDTTSPELASQRPKERMLPRVIGGRRGGLLAAGALALTGLIFAWQASLLDLGHIGLPGPGFFPLVLAALLAFFSALIAIETRLASFKD